ncbi:MAG: hypothetical protein PHW75_02825 [Patescibacteria group bacterium]|nr:hypothetical protein [Patescibacteria group bacterium]
MRSVDDLTGKSAVDVVNYLLKNHKIKKFCYRAYIKKTEDQFDKSIEGHNLDNLSELFSKVKREDERYLISFQSCVLTQEGYHHFPMIDFSNFIINDLSIDDVERVLKDLGESNGYILDSGRCYHYYGNRLLTDDEWINFMKQCSKHPEIGERYISHQLRRGMASLRITTDNSKPKLPTVVKIFQV